MLLERTAENTYMQVDIDSVAIEDDSEGSGGCGGGGV
jgi:hypothetical protein